MESEMENCNDELSTNR